MFLPKLKTANLKTQGKVLVNLFIFFIFVNANVLTSKVNAASFYINPATGSVLTSTFELTVSLDSKDTTNVKSVDAYINFEPNLVQVESINKIGLTSNSTATYNNSLGTIHIKGDFIQTPESGSIVNFAKLFLSVKSNSKGKPVNFTFEEGINKSSVLDVSGTEKLNQTIGADLLIDVTSNETMVYQATSTAVPKTGNSDIVFYLVSLAITIFLSSLLLRKYAVTKL